MFRFLNRLSIGGKLLAIIMITATAALLAACAALLAFGIADARQDLKTDLSLLAGTIAGPVRRLAEPSLWSGPVSPRLPSCEARR